MKIAIIGGGPAGLYASILLKKQRPEAEITVYERNRADDTFGFAWCFPTRRWTISRNTTRRAIAASPRNSPIGTISRCISAAPCIGSAAQRLLRLFAPQAAADPAGTGEGTRRPPAVPVRHRRRVSFRGCRSRGAGRRHQQPLPRQICRPLPARSRRSLQHDSPGWAPVVRSTPSPSFSRRPSGARSSPTPINMKWGTRPGSSRPIRKPSSAPASRA